jgi:hypothetical protein
MKDGRSVSLWAEDMAVWQRWYAALREAVADLLFTRVFQLQCVASPSNTTDTTAPSSPTSSKDEVELSIKKLEIGMRRGSLLLPPAHCHILRAQRLRNIKLDLTDAVQRLSKYKQALSREDILTLVKRAECDRLLMLDAAYMQLQRWLKDPLSGILNQVEVQLDIGKEEISLSDITAQVMHPNMEIDNTNTTTITTSNGAKEMDRSDLQSPVMNKFNPASTRTDDIPPSSSETSIKRKRNQLRDSHSSPSSDPITAISVEQLATTMNTLVDSAEEAMFLVHCNSAASSDSGTGSGCSKGGRQSAADWSRPNSASSSSEASSTASERSICLSDDEEAREDVVVDIVEKRTVELLEKKVTKDSELWCGDELQIKSSPTVTESVVVDSNIESIQDVTNQAERNSAASPDFDYPPVQIEPSCIQMMTNKCNQSCAQGMTGSSVSEDTSVDVKSIEGASSIVVDEQCIPEQHGDVWKPRPSMTPAKLPVSKQSSKKPMVPAPSSASSSTATTVSMLDPSMHKVYQRCVRQLYTQHLHFGAGSFGSKALSPLPSRAMGNVIDAAVNSDGIELCRSLSIVPNNVDLSFHPVTTPSMSHAHCEHFYATPPTTSLDISALTPTTVEVLCGSLNEIPIEQQCEPSPKQVVFNQSTQVTPSLQKELHNLQDNGTVDKEIVLSSECEDVDEPVEVIAMTSEVKERIATCRRYEMTDACDGRTLSTSPDLVANAAAVRLTPIAQETTITQETSPRSYEDQTHMIDDSLFFHISPSSTTVAPSSPSASSAVKDSMINTIISCTSQRDDSLDALNLLATVSSFTSPTSTPLVNHEEREFSRVSAPIKAEAGLSALLAMSPLTPDTMQPITLAAVAEKQRNNTTHIPSEIEPVTGTTIQDEGTSTDDLPGYFQSKNIKFAHPELDQIDEVLELLDELSNSAGASLSQYQHHLYSYPPPPSVIYQTSGTHSCGASTVSMLSQSQQSWHSGLYSHHYHPHHQQLTGAASLSSSMILPEEQSDILCPPNYQQQHHLEHISYLASASPSVSEKSAVDYHGPMTIPADSQNSSEMLQYSQSLLMNASHVSTDYHYPHPQSAFLQSQFQQHQLPSVSSPERSSHFLPSNVSTPAASIRVVSNVHQSPPTMSDMQAAPSPPRMPWDLYRSPPPHHAMMPAILHDAPSNEPYQKGDDDALDVSEIFGRLTFPLANCTIENQPHHLHPLVDSTELQKKTSSALSPPKPAVSLPHFKPYGTSPSQYFSPSKRVAKTVENSRKQDSRNGKKQGAMEEEGEDTYENCRDRSNITTSDSDTNDKPLHRLAKKGTKAKRAISSTLVSATTAASRRGFLMQKLKNQSQMLKELVTETMEKPTEVVSVLSTSNSDTSIASNRSFSGGSTSCFPVNLQQEVTSTKTRVNELTGQLQRVRSKLVDVAFVDNTNDAIESVPANLDCQNAKMMVSNVPVSVMTQDLRMSDSVDSKVRISNGRERNEGKQSLVKVLVLTLLATIFLIVPASYVMRNEAVRSFLWKSQQQHMVAGRYSGLQKMPLSKYSHKSTNDKAINNEWLSSCRAFNTCTNTSHVEKVFKSNEKVAVNVPGFTSSFPPTPASLKELETGSLQRGKHSSDVLVGQLMHERKIQLVRGSQEWLHRPLQFLKSIGKKVKDSVWRLFRGVVAAAILLPPEHHPFLYEYGL